VIHSFVEWYKSEDKRFVSSFLLDFTRTKNKKKEKTKLKFSKLMTREICFCVLEGLEKFYFTFLAWIFWQDEGWPRDTTDFNIV